MKAQEAQTAKLVGEEDQAGSEQAKTEQVKGEETEAEKTNGGGAGSGRG